jgi:hypothetical protein
MRVPRILFKSRLTMAFVLLAVAAMLGGMPRPAAAEDWPTRPVTLVMASAPLAHHLDEIMPMQ